MVSVLDEKPPRVALDNAVIEPTRSTGNALTPHELYGGVFREDGSFEPLSALYRGGGHLVMGSPQEPAPVPVREDDRTILYGGLLYRTHYGHFLVESLARLWAYDGGPIVFVTHPGHPAELSPLNRFFLERAAISPECVEVVSEPIRFARVAIPQPAVEIGGTVAYRVIGDLYRRIAETVPKVREMAARPVYLSRTKFPHRQVAGEVELEAALRERGWRIVYPETLSPLEQVQIVRSANVFCGVVGSAMHNLIFADRGTRVFYVHRNRKHVSTMRTLAALDEICGLNAEYIPADIGDPTPRGPFAIDPQIALDWLCGTAASPP